MRTFTVVRGQRLATVSDTANDGSIEERAIGVEPDSETYRGFDRDFSPVGLDHVVLVAVEGELDVYAIDDPKKVSDLLRYLNDQGENAQIIGAYTRR